MSEAERAGVLAEMRQGGLVPKLAVDAVVFRQEDGVSNRNFVRFKDSKLGKLARSFKGVPFLRDHRQWDLTARGGTVVGSELVDLGGGAKGIRQTIELVADWAVEMALDGRLDRFSIGWNPTGPALCTACGKEMFGADGWCGHWPGDVVEMKNGDETTVEVLFTDAEGIETSGVAVPAVRGTEVEDMRSAAMRAALSTLGGARPPRPLAKDTSMLEQIALALGLAADAPEKDILAAVSRLRAEEAAHVTTKAELAAAQARAAAVEAERDEQRVSTMLDRAVEEGRIRPERDAKGARIAGKLELAIRDMAKKLGLAATEEWVKGLPVIAPIAPRLDSGGGDPTPRREPAGGTDAEPTALELKYARQLGVTPDVLRKTKTLMLGQAADDDKDE